MPQELALTVPPVWSAYVVAALVVTAAVVDVQTGRIPNWLTHGTMVLALAMHWWQGGLRGDDNALGLLGSATGMGLAFLPLGLFWLAGAIGGGDAKMMAAIGALGGWRFALAALSYGIIVAAIMAVTVMIRKRLVRRTMRRVWHAVGLLLLKQKPADPSTPDSPTVPFAVALCIGTLGALLELVIRHVCGPESGTGISKLFLGG